MNEKPSVKTFSDNSKIWQHEFDKFTAKVYIPSTDLPDKIINFGYEAPYLLYFEDTPLSLDEAKSLADSEGFSEIAKRKATSVVFISPKANWEDADESLWIDLIANSKIHQYHEDGYAILINRFSHTTDGYAIRGAIFRTFVFAKNKAADFVATKLLKTINGDGLWGPADVTLTACILKNLSVTPSIERRDMPFISINNSKEINNETAKQTDHFYIASSDADAMTLYNNYLRKYMRWGWVGDLMTQPDFEELGMNEEFCSCNIKTSPDNNGDDKGTAEHEVGYIAFYNKNLFEKGKAPLLLCFHGGGDSAMHISEVSGWYRVAHDHEFLLVCVEDHINSTATEMMELLQKLKSKYAIDETRIYATGFSMGGCKTWDMCQEYPKVFAGLAPMDATFEVGLNVFGNPAPVEINKDTLVPIFYVGGEVTPLPELPFQADKCLDRMKYVFGINKVVKEYNAEFEDHENWSNRIWGVDGDEIVKVRDEERDAVMTIHYFLSSDGQKYTAFASVDNQGHECRYHSCDQAYRFLKNFTRDTDGKINLPS